MLLIPCILVRQGEVPLELIDIKLVLHFRGCDLCLWSASDPWALILNTELDTHLMVVYLLFACMAILLRVL